MYTIQNTFLIYFIYYNFKNLCINVVLFLYTIIKLQETGPQILSSMVLFNI